MLRPLWEKYLWAQCYKHPTFTQDTIEKAFELLAEQLGIGPPVSWQRSDLDFRGVMLNLAPDGVPPSRVFLTQIKDFVDVNA